VKVTDLGSSHGTFIVQQIGVDQLKHFSRQVKFDDWHHVENLFAILGESIAMRSQSNYDRRKYMTLLIQAVVSWASLDKTYQRQLLRHLLTVRGWRTGDARQSAEWLRRFFRMYHHVFYLSPDAVLSQGRKGLILLGRVRQYTPVNWRGFQSVTYVEPIFTNAKGGFKPSSNDDEALVLLDNTPLEKKYIGVHEAQHAFDILVFSEYGMQQVGSRLTREQEQSLPGLSYVGILGWELEYTAYLRTLIELGRAIESADDTGSRASLPPTIAQTFAGEEVLNVYLEMGESAEEHARATHELLPTFITNVLTRMGTSLPPGQQMGNGEIKTHLGTIEARAPGRVIREVAQEMLDNFYMGKLGYAPNYPNVMKLRTVAVDPPSVKSLWGNEAGLYRLMEGLQRNAPVYQKYSTRLEALGRLAHGQRSQAADELTFGGLMRAIGYFVQFPRPISTGKDVEELFEDAGNLLWSIKSLVVARDDSYHYPHKGAWIDISNYLESALKVFERQRDKFIQGARQGGPIPILSVALPPVSRESSSRDGGITTSRQATIEQIKQSARDGGRAERIEAPSHRVTMTLLSP